MTPRNDRKNPLMHLVAGGVAGVVESSCCHPLDTVKTRMQLRIKGGSTKGPLRTASSIITKEGFLALYKGLSAVMMGIVPKMAVRFTSFETYKEWLGASPTGNKGLVFLAGLGSGVTEAVVVVTPAEVCKIRMQAQFHSLLDPEEMARRKYRNVLQTAVVVAREEGVGALYKGLAPTVLRQGCNQAVNFTCYQMFKTQLSLYTGSEELASWQHMLLGGLSGGIGPCVNNPLDVVKTRLQKQVVIPGQAPKYGGFMSGISLIAKEEGVKALWKGLTPRLMRIMPGQAITFMTYEWVSKRLPASFTARK
ncbi:unnamed protein product [Ectocarpus sp. CCAP 1310/34]|nr:unnamed protein product [Ectocarpus sp. CCAP 1310/34]